MNTTGGGLQWYDLGQKLIIALWFYKIFYFVQWYVLKKIPLVKNLCIVEDIEMVFSFNSLNYNSLRKCTKFIHECFHFRIVVILPEIGLINFYPLIKS